MNALASLSAAFRPTTRTRSLDAQAARGLGFVSFAIGLTELLLPRQIDRLLGTGSGEHVGLIRLMGLRELLHGVAVLAPRDPAPGIYSRVGGDMLDGALLAAAATQTRNPAGLATAIALVAPVVIADMVVAKRLAGRRQSHLRPG